MNWKRTARQEFSTKAGILSYQKQIQNNLSWREKEQEWVDNYLQPLIDLMGESRIWKCMAGNNIELYGVLYNDLKRSSRNIKVSENPQAFFSRVDSVGHWYSRAANEKNWFDPYNDYQVFALMNLVGSLPPLENQKSFKNYYVYTKEALRFIKHVIKRCLHLRQRVMYLRKVRECLRHPNLCLNAIHIKRESFLLS
jgi:hypothetical protein